MGWRELHKYEFICDGLYPEGDARCGVRTTIWGYHPVDAETRLTSWIRTPEGLLCHADHLNDPRGTPHA